MDTCVGENIVNNDDLITFGKYDNIYIYIPFIPNNSLAKVITVLFQSSCRSRNQPATQNL